MMSGYCRYASTGQADATTTNASQPQNQMYRRMFLRSAFQSRKQPIGTSAIKLPKTKPLARFVMPRTTKNASMAQERLPKGDKETGRQGDKETGRQGDGERPASLSPCLAVSLSFAPLVSFSP